MYKRNVQRRRARFGPRWRKIQRYVRNARNAHRRAVRSRRRR